MARRKRARATSPQSQPAASTLTHREFVLLRNDRLALMFNAIEASPKVKRAFQRNPASIASRFDVTLSPEEIQAIKLFGGTPRELEHLLALGGGGVAFFDSNCKCSAVLDIAGELINPPSFLKR